MTGVFDYCVDGAKDPVIAVRGGHGAIRSVIWPVTPVLALRIFVVLFVVLIDEPLRAAPDGLHNPGPRVAYANISGRAGACTYLFPFLIPHDSIDTERRRSCAAALHRTYTGVSCAEKHARLRLPPGVD